MSTPSVCSGLTLSGAFFAVLKARDWGLSNGSNPKLLEASQLTLADFDLHLIQNLPHFSL
jgi:hypothetical protein